MHTVLPHPRDPARLLVAMSTGGVYRTERRRRDAGRRATPASRPTSCPTRGRSSASACTRSPATPADPERLYAQNHHGVYRSDDDGRTWSSIADGLPSDFGFPMVAHPRRGGTVWTFPLVADGERFPPDHRCRVFRSTDAGGKLGAAVGGAARGPFYPAVLRDAMCADDADPAGVYFGTRSGEVFASRDEGDSWSPVAAHLPDVLCVRAAAV